MAWDFETDPAWQDDLDWTEQMVRERIEPLEVLDLDHVEYRRRTKALRKQVKERGLWATFLSRELGGPGLGQVHLALINEILGRSELAPPVFGCQAPDSGNIELLALAASDHQRERWLEPLYEGDIRSAFAMTEQGCGSDPTRLRTRADRETGGWVLNGRKWYVSAGDRAQLQIVMAVTDPAADPRQRATMFLVPADARGIEIRPIGSMIDPLAGSSPVHSQAEVTYNDVRVDDRAVLGEIGGAFELAQKRLGPGRIHHCMRWIGVCRRAFDSLCERALSAEAQGEPLAEKQFVQGWIADSAAAIESFRLLTLRAAWKIDRFGAKAARTEIAMIKYFGTSIMHDVIDRAIQVHGSLGYSTDMPLEAMQRWARAARFYDGPDEIHKVTVARRVLREYKTAMLPTEHIPSRKAAAGGVAD